MTLGQLRADQGIAGGLDIGPPKQRQAQPLIRGQGSLRGPASFLKALAVKRHAAPRVGEEQTKPLHLALQQAFGRPPLAPLQLE